MKRVKSLMLAGRKLLKIYHRGGEMRLESGLSRVEITDSSVNVVNVKNMMSADYLLYNLLGSKSLNFDSFNFKCLRTANYCFAYNNNTKFDFSRLEFPVLVSAFGMFYGCSAATGYPAQFPNLVDASYMFRVSGIKRIEYDFTRCISIYCMADGGAKVEHVDLNIPKATNGYNAFNSAALLKTARLVAPMMTNYQNMFASSGVAVVEILNTGIDALAKVGLNNIAGGCKNLVNFSMSDTSRVFDAVSAFANTPALVSVPLSYPYLTAADSMFLNSNMGSGQINAILESLPGYTTGVHRITFTGCPGAAGCSPEIATAKGWTVEI